MISLVSLLSLINRKSLNLLKEGGLKTYMDRVKGLVTRKRITIGWEPKVTFVVSMVNKVL